MAAVGLWCLSVLFQSSKYLVLETRKAWDGDGEIKTVRSPYCLNYQRVLAPAKGLFCGGGSGQTRKMVLLQPGLLNVHTCLSAVTSPHL